MEYILIYVVGGAFCNFMRGYNAPASAQEDGVLNAWFVMMAWPIFLPLMVKALGIITRSGEKK